MQTYSIYHAHHLHSHPERFILHKCMPRYKAQIHSSEEEQLRQTSAEGILRKKNPSMDKREEIDKDDQGTNDGCNEDDDVTIATQRISNVTNAGEAAAAARRFQKVRFPLPRTLFLKLF